MRQSDNPSVRRSVGLSKGRFVGQSVGRSVDMSVCRSVSHSVSLPVGPSRTVSRSVDSYRRAPLVVLLLLLQLLFAARLVGFVVLRETGSGVPGGAYSSKT